MKILLTYTLGFSLAWLGLLSLLAGLAAWPQPGAFLPVAVGLALLPIAARFLLGWARQYLPPRVSSSD